MTNLYTNLATGARCLTSPVVLEAGYSGVKSLVFVYAILQLSCVLGQRTLIVICRYQENYI